MKILEINRKDLVHNINKIKEYIKKDSNCEIIAVVKGNGYGLGLVEYTKFLIDNGIDFFAVSTIEEAIELRKSGIKEKILMLSSTAIKQEIEQLIDNNIIITIGSNESLKLVQEIGQERNITISAHIKIDTGFGRYGFLYNQIEDLIEKLKNSDKIKIEGCYSHFSESYSKKENWTNIQYERFLRVIENLKLNNIEIGMLHICNSSAALRYKHMKLNAVRIGSAFTGRILVENTLGLKRIGKLVTQVAETKILPKGFNIGYSNTYKTKKETKIAILPVGYFDGINMGTNNDSFRIIDHIRYIYNNVKDIFRKPYLYVNINNKEYRIIGKFGLYNTIVDIKHDNIKPGDMVVIETKPLYINSKIRREYK